MSYDSRRRLARVVRHADADLAEAALLVAAEHDPRLDVDVGLLRIDALADGLRSSGFRSTEPAADARTLADYLARRHGFTGAAEPEPAGGLLPEVLDRKHGASVTLSILYVAIARRLQVPAFAIGLPGLVATGIGGGEQPVVLDPSRGGQLLDQAAIAAHVDQATRGRLAFRRSMLRPSPPAHVVRRLLNELTRTFTQAGRTIDALWTVELKLLLPNRLPDDHRVHGDLLAELGRFDVAARAYEAYLEAAGPDAPDRAEVRAAAVAVRARMN